MQNYSYPSSSNVVVSGIGNPVGQPVPNEAVFIGAENPSGDLEGLKVDGSGNLLVSSSTLPTGAATAANQVLEIAQLSTKLSGSLVPVAYDEIALTYVVSGPGIGQVETATYKNLGVTVKTLTLTYDVGNNLSSVVAS